MTYKPATIPKDWAGPIIYAWHRNDNFARMARDAIARATADKRFDDANMYRNMLDQFGDFCGDMP